MNSRGFFARAAEAASGRGARGGGGEGARRRPAGRSWTAVATALLLAIAGATRGDGAWKVAAPGRPIVLPADHVSHPDYKIEWWYYTGNVDAADGRRFGYQLTFFRVGVDPKPSNPSRWALRDLHMAHFALTDLRNGRFYFFDRLQRDGAGWAGAATDRYAVWNGKWSVEAQPDGSHLLRAQGDSRDSASGGARGGAQRESPHGAGSGSSAQGDGVSIELRLRGTERWVAHGRGGYSQKGRAPGNASHYYSLTRLGTRGTVTVAGQRFDVTGASWMDHEFGTSMLEASQLGWDWFALQLEDGRDVMLYQMRRRDGPPQGDGSRDPFSSGSIVARDGSVVHLSAADYTLEPLETWRSPATNTSYPTRWRVTIPSQHLALDVRAAMPNQELHTPHSTGVTYWEGAVDVSGAGAARGRGYMELTGYSGVPLSDSLR